MSWGALAGGILGAGVAIYGGNKDRSLRKAELAATRPDAIRREAEKAGFNPLLFTNAAFQTPGGGPTFGQSLSQAGSLLAGGIADWDAARRAERQRQTAVEQQNQELRRQVEQQALRLSQRSVYQTGVFSPQGVRDAHLGSVSAGQYSDGRPWAFGGNALGTQTDTTDAEEFEERYGDVVSSIYGLGVLGRDVYAHIKSRVASSFDKYKKEQPEAQVPREDAPWADSPYPWADPRYRNRFYTN